MNTPTLNIPCIDYAQADYQFNNKLLLEAFKGEYNAVHKLMVTENIFVNGLSTPLETTDRHDVETTDRQDVETTDRQDAAQAVLSHIEGVKLLKAASEGKIGEIRRIFETSISEKTGKLLGLHNVNQNTSEQFSLLHYAVSKDQMDIAAFLSNRGANWEALSVTKHGTGRTPLNFLNSKECRLKELLRAYCNLQEPINFSSLFKLLSSCQLSVKGKQAVLIDKDIRKAIKNRFKADEAACILALCTVGSFDWKRDGNKTYSEHCKNQDFESYPLEGPMNCHTLVIYLEQSFGLLQNNFNLDFEKTQPLDVIRIILDRISRPTPNLSKKNLNDPTIKHPTTNSIVKTLGCNLDRTTNIPEILEISSETIVQTLFMWINEMWLPFILVKGEFGNFIIHMDEKSKVSSCEKAETIIRRYQSVSPDIRFYIGNTKWDQKKSDDQDYEQKVHNMLVPANTSPSPGLSYEKGSSATTKATIAQFDRNSAGYKMIKAASKGDIAEIQRIFSEVSNSEQKRQLLGLQHVLAGRIDRYTPLHYALSENHLDVAALFANHGADWDIHAEKEDGVGVGITCYEQLNKNENRLCKFLKGYCNLQEPIDFSNLFKLLSSPQLSLKGKQAVLKDRELREAILQKFTLDEAACIFALCATGSFQWDGSASEAYNEHCKKYNFDTYPLNNAINCHAFVVYIKQLCKRFPNDVIEGTKTHLEINVAKLYETPKFKKFFTLLSENRGTYVAVNNLAMMLGCDFKTSIDDSKILAKFPTLEARVIFLETSFGFIHHIGLLIKGLFGNYVIHINGKNSSHVECEKIETFLDRYHKEQKLEEQTESIYLGSFV